jgi:hypothetical protein
MKALIVSSLILTLVAYWVIGETDSLYSGPRLGKEVYIKETATTTETKGENATTSMASSTENSITHIKTPEHVKAIYMSSWVAGTPSVREPLIKLIESTELNAVVIDVKDNTGVLSWDGRIKDLDILIKELHDKNVYVIARIASFQDPLYVQKHPELAVKNVNTGNVWKDRKGVPWVDTGSRVMWEYLAQIGKEAYSRVDSKRYFY